MENTSTVATVGRTVSAQTFGPASRYMLEEFVGRDGATTWFVLDAEVVDEDDLAQVIRQESTREAALAGFGPWCLHCEKTFDHGCNSGFCSEACERAGIDADAYADLIVVSR
jgi:hypothetical protein